MHTGEGPTRRVPQLISGRRIAGGPILRVVIEYVPGAKTRGAYNPQTATLTIYRGREAENRILLLI